MGVIYSFMEPSGPGRAALDFGVSSQSGFTFPLSAAWRALGSVPMPLLNEGGVLGAQPKFPPPIDLVNITIRSAILCTINVRDDPLDVHTIIRDPIPLIGYAPLYAPNILVS